jgi:IPT/TIG domain
MNQPSRFVRSHWILNWLAAAACLFAITGCGGGGNGGSGGPPPSPDFSLVVSPSSQSVDAGGMASVSVSATPANGFSSQVDVQITGTPTGVSASPASFKLNVGTAQSVTLTAAANAPTANTSVTLTGTSGSLTHASRLSLTVNGLANGVPVRTRYVRTDATTEYFGWVNQHWMVYHAATHRYFVTDPSSNHVIVVDAASQTEIGTISVPGAFGIDDTPDHSTLYVGTMIGDVYTIDPVGLAVTHRYIASQIGPYGYQASIALVLSDGRVALMSPLNGIDGTNGIAVWNPTDNSITIYGGFIQGSLPLPCGNFPSNLGGFSRTVDRAEILVGGINGGLLCAVDASTGTGTYVGVGASTLHLVTTPDGKYIILPSYPTGVNVYDANSLATVAQFDVLGDTSSAAGLFVSADSKTLFVPTDTIIYAYNLATRQLAGWTPNIYMPPIGGGFAFGPIDSPYFLATDGTGVFAGPMEEGIGFIDLSTLQTGAIGTQFTNGYLVPATGPAPGGTATKWSTPGTVGTLKSVYFGTKQATSISANGGYINATSPSGKAGPADVYAFTNDGGMQLLPEAFNYGPTILEVTPHMATAEGGGTGYIYGYGLGPVTSNAIPPDLRVTIGGSVAQIMAFVPYAYNTISPPYPLQSAAFRIPPGVTGTTVDVVVTTNSGSTTTSAALTYLPPIQQYSLTGSTLVQGIYDSHRDLYYFTDTNKVRVFSLAQGKWLTPINIPAPAGRTQRLWGIALSPDGKKMAVADATAGAIYLLDPTNPASVQTFLVGSVPGGSGNPCGVALSDGGIAYYVTVGSGIGGERQFFKLNTNNGQITDYGIAGTGINGDAGLRIVISSDNARVYFNDDGYVFYIDTATDKFFPATVGFTCCYGNYELALSSNQTQFSGSFYIYDSDLNGESYYALNDREILNILYVYGAKLSSDGRLLFQPSTNGIDVFDGRLGNLLARVSLPVSLSPNYDALVADGRDNVLIAITNTGNGIAVVDLTSIGEPKPLPYESDLVSKQQRLRHFSHRPLFDKLPPPSMGRTSQSKMPVRNVPYVKSKVLPKLAVRVLDLPR